jgi:glycosyltransferase involved in cell wall biosynthesis
MGPLCSVVIPVRNRRDSVAMSIQSAFAAAKGANVAVEIIVVDDGSTDESAAVARSAGATVVTHPESRGAAAARNTGARAARGAVLGFLDSDDTWSPNLLSVLVPVLEHGTAAFVFGRAVIKEDGRSDRAHGLASRGVVTLGDPRTVLTPVNPVPASATLINREAFEAVGGYNEAVRISEDLDLWVRLLVSGTAVGVPTFVSEYSRHPGGKSNSPEALAARIALGDQYLKNGWIDERTRILFEGALRWANFRSTTRTVPLRRGVLQLSSLLRRPGVLTAAVLASSHNVALRRAASASLSLPS